MREERLLFRRIGKFQVLLPEDLPIPVGQDPRAV